MPRLDVSFHRVDVDITMCRSAYSEASWILRCQSSGYIDTCMWLAATYNEPNIRTAPTAKLIATAKTNA